MPTINELYAFIERADTVQKVDIAREWFKRHRLELSLSVYDDMIKACDFRLKEIFRENWKKINAYETRMLLVSEETGEVISEI